MLKTVLENLIDNAEKYSDYGSDITINVSMMYCQSAINARHLTGKISQNCGSLISEPQREIIRVAAE